MLLMNLRRAFMPAMAVSALMLTGCAGMSASYDSESVEPENIEVIPVTAGLIAQQAQEAAAAEQAEKASVQNALSSTDYRYVIRPADVLLISVPTIVSFNAANAPSVLGEQGQGYVVYHDGTIYLPFSGSVAVGGLTLREAQEKIVDALSRFLRSPQVIVSISQFRSQRVMVTGQVQRPGYQPVNDVPLTLVGALSSAGGISELRGRRDPRPVGSTTVQNQIPPEFPDLSRVVLKRGGTNFTINVEDVLKSGDVSQDILLKDGDVVVVPPTRRANIIVMGEVLRPALLEVTPEDTNLAQVLMSVGGINQLSANPGRVYVIRGDFVKPTIYQVDASSPDAMLLAQKFEMQPKDVVFVAEAGVTRWNRALQTILPTVQGLLSTAIIVDTVNDVGN